MPIQAQNLTMRAAAVMDDTPTNGGLPSATLIPDGGSNAIFPDVSELDRLGNVRARKVYLSVDTDDVSVFMGANTVISEAPTDPNVSIVMFPAASAAETQADMLGRVFETTSAFSGNKAEYLSDRAYVEQFVRGGGGGVWDGTPILGDVIKLRVTDDTYGAADTLYAAGEALTLVEFIDDAILKVERREIVRMAKNSIMYTGDAGAYYAYFVTLELDGITRYPTWSAASRFVSASVAQNKSLYGTYIAAQDITTIKAFEFYGAAITTAALDIGATSIPVSTISAGIVPTDLVDHPDAESILGFAPGQLTKNADGREPIFKQYRRIVIGKDVVITKSVINGEVVNFGEADLTSVKIVGSGGAAITAGFAVDLDAGTVTFSSVAGYAQPITLTARAEDMAQISGISGNTLSIPSSRPLRRTYPAGATVSSALVHGDRRARVLGVLSRSYWDTDWATTVEVAASTAVFDVTNYPVVVTNAGTVSDRVRLEFTNATTYRAISENFGVLGVGSTGSTFAPINPATSKPFFTINPGAFGAGGWQAGNQVLIELEGAHQPLWLLRCIQMSPTSLQSFNFRLSHRGHVDRP